MYALYTDSFGPENKFSNLFLKYVGPGRRTYKHMFVFGLDPKFRRLHSEEFNFVKKFPVSKEAVVEFFKTKRFSPVNSSERDQVLKVLDQYTIQPVE